MAEVKQIHPQIRNQVVLTVEQDGGFIDFRDKQQEPASLLSRF